MFDMSIRDFYKYTEKDVEVSCSGTTIDISGLVEETPDDLSKEGELEKNHMNGEFYKGLTNFVTHEQFLYEDATIGMELFINDWITSYPELLNSEILHRIITHCQNNNLNNACTSICVLFQAHNVKLTRGHIARIINYFINDGQIEKAFYIRNKFLSIAENEIYNILNLGIIQNQLVICSTLVAELILTNKYKLDNYKILLINAALTDKNVLIQIFPILYINFRVGEFLCSNNILDESSFEIKISYLNDECNLELDTILNILKLLKKENAMMPHRICSFLHVFLMRRKIVDTECLQILLESYLNWGFLSGAAVILYSLDEKFNISSEIIRLAKKQPNTKFQELVEKKFPDELVETENTIWISDFHFNTEFISINTQLTHIYEQNKNLSTQAEQIYKYAKNTIQNINENCTVVKLAGFDISCNPTYGLYLGILFSPNSDVCYKLSNDMKSIQPSNNYIDLIIFKTLCLLNYKDAWEFIETKNLNLNMKCLIISIYFESIPLANNIKPHNINLIFNYMETNNIVFDQHSLNKLMNIFEYGVDMTILRTIINRLSSKSYKIDICIRGSFFTSTFDIALKNNNCYVIDWFTDQFVNSPSKDMLKRHLPGLLIKALSKLRKLQNCWKVWDSLCAARLEENEITYGCMFDALVCNNEIDNAIKLFDEMTEKGVVRPNTIMYSTFIKGYAQTKQLHKALIIYKNMRKNNIVVNTVTYNCLMDACARVGSMDVATDLLVDMINENVPTDLITFSTIVKGYASSGEIEKSIQLFSVMKERNIKPDGILFNSLLDGCVRGGRPELCEQIWDEMQQSKITPSNFTLTILIKMYGRTGQLEKAFEIFESFPKKFNFQINAHAYTCLMSACIANKEYEKTFEVYNKMKNHGISADTKTFETVVYGLTRANYLHKAIEILEESLKCYIQGKIKQFLDVRPVRSLIAKLELNNMTELKTRVLTGILNAGLKSPLYEPSYDRHMPIVMRDDGNNTVKTFTYRTYSTISENNDLSPPGLIK